MAWLGKHKRKLPHKCNENILVGADLREQVTYLGSEYESVGDQLEQEQSRSTQVCHSHT